MGHMRHASFNPKIKEPHKGLKGLESLRCYHSDVNLPGQLTHKCNI